MAKNKTLIGTKAPMFSGRRRGVQFRRGLAIVDAAEAKSLIAAGYIEVTGAKALQEIWPEREIKRALSALAEMRQAPERPVAESK